VTSSLDGQRPRLETTAREEAAGGASLMAVSDSTQLEDGDGGYNPNTTWRALVQAAVVDTVSLRLPAIYEVTRRVGNLGTMGTSTVATGLRGPGIWWSDSGSKWCRVGRGRWVRWRGGGVWQQQLAWVPCRRRHPMVGPTWKDFTDFK
jgi:hypothetical protein